MLLLLWSERSLYLAALVGVFPVAHRKRYIVLCGIRFVDDERIILFASLIYNNK